jgi:peptidoglycan/LPS O-acetylase OafA/YrhL
VLNDGCRFAAEAPGPSMREIKSLTGLRGFAALWVCLLHYTWGWKGPGFWLSVATHGEEGLDVFFILSGFILSYVYSGQFQTTLSGSDYLAFLRARFARVYPLHFFMLMGWVAFVLLGVIELNKGDTVQAFILNLFLLHAWGFVDLISWNQPSWSISSEAFAYLLFPFLGALLFRRPWLNAPIIGLAAAWSLSFSPPYPRLISKLIRHGYLHPGVQFANGVSLFHFFSLFVAGMVLFVATRKMQNILPSLANYGIMLAGLGLLAYSCTIPFYDPIVIIGSCLLIAALFRDEGAASLIFGNTVAVFLGEISYALYLSHILCGVVITIYFGLVPLWIKLAIALFVSICLYFGLERPCRGWIRTHLKLPTSAHRHVSAHIYPQAP